MPRILQPIPTPTFIDTSNQENNSVTFEQPNFLTANIDYNYTITNSTTPNDNEIIFYNTITWVLKIKDKQIIFNTQHLTIDEITKTFLKRLSEFTHIDGLQYTFDF